MSSRIRSWIWRDRYNRARDAACGFIVELLPRRVVYFATIKVWAFATSGKYGDTLAPEITTAETIERWEKTLPGHDTRTDAEKLIDTLRKESMPVRIEEKSVPMRIDDDDDTLRRAIKRGQEENGHGET